MNYLAHLALSYPQQSLLCGNYLGDLITKNEEQTLHPDFAKGIQFHRWIDTFSNNHQDLENINKNFHIAVHKYAPVLTDIICDHLLYNSWHYFYTVPFNDFKSSSYTILENHLNLMPERISRICKNMIEHDWLSQYQTIEGLELVLKRTNKRARFDVDFTKGLSILEAQIDILSALFASFYKDCKNQSIRWLNLQNGEKY